MVVFVSEGDDTSTQELIDQLQRQVEKMDLKLRHKRTSSRDLVDAISNNKPNGSFTVIGRYWKGSWTYVIIYERRILWSNAFRCPPTAIWLGENNC